MFVLSVVPVLVVEPVAPVVFAVLPVFWFCVGVICPELVEELPVVDAPAALPLVGAGLSQRHAEGECQHDS